MPQTVSRNKLIKMGLLSGGKDRSRKNHTKALPSWIYFTKVNPIKELQSYQDDPFFQYLCSKQGLRFTKKSITLEEENHLYKVTMTKQGGVYVTKDGRLLPVEARSQYNNVTEREDALYRIEGTICFVLDEADEKQEDEYEQDHELLLQDGLRRELINELDYYSYGGKFF